MYCTPFTVDSRVEHDTGQFPVQSRTRNQYTMMAYHLTILILTEPLSSMKDKFRIKVYNNIMSRLTSKGLGVELQFRGNGAIKEYKRIMTEERGTKYQSVIPYTHIRNAVESASRSSNAPFWGKYCQGL